MANRFFTFLANLVAYQRAKAGDVSANFTLLETGLGLAADELDRTVHCQPTDPAIGALPLKAVRANRAFFFDGNGDPIAVIAATTDQMAAAVAAASSAATSAASVAATQAAMCARTVRVTGPVHQLAAGTDHVVEYAGAVTLSWPATANDADVLRVTLANGRIDNRITAGPVAVMGTAGEDYVFDQPEVSRTFKYYAGINGWRIV